jgi:hypothetical protein
VRQLLCGNQRNQSKANERKLLSEPFKGFIQIIDRKLPISDRHQPQQSLTINKEKFFTTEVNLFGGHPESTVSIRGGRRQHGRVCDSPDFKKAKQLRRLIKLN